MGVPLGCQMCLDDEPVGIYEPPQSRSGPQAREDAVQALLAWSQRHTKGDTVPLATTSGKFHPSESIHRARPNGWMPRHNFAEEVSWATPSGPIVVQQLATQVDNWILGWRVADAVDAKWVGTAFPRLAACDCH